jgi:effector-binding domain-containing protein
LQPITIQVKLSLLRLALVNPYEDYPMKNFMRQSAALLLLNLVLLALGGIDAVATEEVKYRVLESSGDFELRQYESSLGAETTVEGDFHEVGNEGFRRLFDYISGKNRKKQSIPMTAPVSQEASSEKIPMTAPVNQEKVGGAWRITFLMPSAFTMETLPEPLDSRVKLVKIPGRLMAALRYSGTWSRERYEDKEKRLKEIIRQRGLKIEGEPVFARYNPPFMPWFLRRNEVLIPVGQVH